MARLLLAWNVLLYLTGTPTISMLLCVLLPVMCHYCCAVQENRDRIVCGNIRQPQTSKHMGASIWASSATNGKDFLASLVLPKSSHHSLQHCTTKLIDSRRFRHCQYKYSHRFFLTLLYYLLSY